MITPDRKKLIDKIVKLLALANSSSFSEEAKTAEGMAAELLAKARYRYFRTSGRAIRHR